MSGNDGHDSDSPAPDPSSPEGGHVRELNDGYEDGLQPLESLDVANASDFDLMLQGMALTAFGGRRMGEAAEVLYEMVTDPECSVVLTLSGAMTVGKMGLVITEMIERGWVQAIVSTGALMTHGLVELAGMPHFKAKAELDDKTLFDKGYNRVYDTYEAEQNLNDLEALLRQVFELMPTDRRWSSRELCAKVGEVLDQPGRRGIMVAAYRNDVPIYIPAFTDSEMGLDVGTWLLAQRLQAADTAGDVDAALTSLASPFDPFLDLGSYARFILRSPRIGIFTIGGGVPRNWAQQAPPFIDIINVRVGLDLPLNRFRYGVRICPEPVHWGGLSGCTYSEGVSWGKFLPASQGGRFAEVHSDATIAWPIIVKAVMERLAKSGAEVLSPGVEVAPST